jgi:SAM-dependent methyltransferase
VVFDAYARYYDLLYRDKDYAAEAEYVAAHIRERAPRATRILELGCGTGGHAEHFARNGFTVHGVDLSDAMLARAEARKDGFPPDVAARLSFESGDVRSIRVGQTFDAVTALFHVINYQVADAALAAMFDTAAAHLCPGGLFLFDFWYGPAVLTQRPEVRVKRLNDDAISVTRIAEPVLQVNDDVVDVSYTVFIETKATGTLNQVFETHKMRYLFLPELTRFHGTAFSERATFEWMTKASLSASSWAGFQVLERTAAER